MTLKKLISLGLTLLVVTVVTVSASVVAWRAGETGEVALTNAAKSQLTIARDMQKHTIETYFKTIFGQIRMFANNPNTVSAMTRMKMSYEFVSESDLKEADLLGLQQYYHEYFDAKFQSSNRGESANPDSLLMPLSNREKLFQANYISNNKNPLGEKQKLESAQTGSQYDIFHSVIHSGMRDYLEEFGYYDIFLVEPENGTIVYSVSKSIDYATSLKTGPYAETGVGEAFRLAMESHEPGQVSLVDFSPYLPSYNHSSAFVSTPIFKNGTKHGILIFQIPVAPINTIMTNNHQWREAGLGETGESYLVGEDMTMRSVSRPLEMQPQQFARKLVSHGLSQNLVDTMLTKNNTIGLMPVNTAASNQVSLGKTGVVESSSYYGEPSISAYSPLHIPGVNWGIISEITQAEAISAATTLRKSIMTFSLMIIVVFALAAIFIGGFLGRKLVAPLMAASETAETIAAGQLSTDVGTSDAKNEIAQLIRSLARMATTLKSIVTKIHSGASNLDESAREFALQSDDLAKRTEEQATAVHQTVVTLSQLSEIASSNSQLAESAYSKTADMKQFAEDSEQAMTSMITSISDIKISSSKILDVVNVVEEIAFQTNLLALNASVEAARAGEHGRGFAVVATEVRNLALRSAEAVKKIDDLAKDSSTLVEQGANHADRMNSILNEFKASAGSVRDVVSNIGSASNDQARMIAGLNETVGNIENMTQQNAASVNQSAIGSRRLEKLSSELQENVSYFQV